jgi:hypothetical protein
MPGTYTFNELAIAASDCVSTGVTDAKTAMASNMALFKIWNVYDWRDTLADLPPFYLVPGTQDYGAPCIAVPSDFLGLRRAYYYNLSVSGDVPKVKPLTCPGDLEVTDIPNEPSSMCYRPAVSKFRVHPMPPSSYGSPFHIIDGQYKKKPFTTNAAGTTITRITSALINSALIPFGDVYLTMWIEAMKWALMTLANDPKAGQVQVQNGVEGYSGQMGKMMAEVQTMALKEAGELASPMMYPKEPLMNQWGWI